MFSLSDSKRVYYILPILPFCAVLTARFMLSPDMGILEKIRNILLKIYVLFIPLIVLLFLSAAAAGMFGGSWILKMDFRRI